MNRKTFLKIKQLKERLGNIDCMKPYNRNRIWNIEKEIEGLMKNESYTTILAVERIIYRILNKEKTIQR